MAIERIGVVGAGQMGNGIAHVFAQAGFEILLTDISQDALDKAVSVIDRNLERQVSKELLTSADKSAALARIHTTQKLTDLGPTDLIIEAATEREEIKNAIFKELTPHLTPDTILTSNTSSNVQSLRRCGQETWQNLHRVRGFPRLYREPHPDAHDQRGDLHPV